MHIQAGWFVFFVSIFLFAESVVAGESVAESDTARLVQFSGVVMTSDSLHPVPLAHIIIRNTNRGTASNFQGFFSFVAQAGDTIQFSALGFQKKEFVIPHYLQAKKYSVIQLLTQDTIYLPETLIYPWPSWEQLKNVFLSLNIPDDDLERAKKNLQREMLKEMGQAMPADAEENQDFAMQQYATGFYTQGQYPSFQIFNPLAWVAFIEAWKRGDFKKK